MGGDSVPSARGGVPSECVPGRGKTRESACGGRRVAKSRFVRCRTWLAARPLPRRAAPVGAAESDVCVGAAAPRRAPTGWRLGAAYGAPKVRRCQRLKPRLLRSTLRLPALTRALNSLTLLKRYPTRLDACTPCPIPRRDRWNHQTAWYGAHRAAGAMALSAREDVRRVCIEEQNCMCSGHWRGVP